MEGIEADKSLRLIEYLQDLVRLSSKVVYDVASYHSVLWFSEIPKQKGCFTQAWKVSEQAPEIWLEVKKHPEPPIPEIPEKCEDWINKESLYDSDEIPELYSTIQQDTEEVVDGETRVATHSLNLSDFPEVSLAWDDYLENAWLPWMERHQVWKSIQKIYSKLFEIHQQQLKLGEEYELVLGLGLLQWHVPNGQSVRRHLMIAKANLEFDHRSGRFTLTADEDGAKLDVELNMLDEYQPVTAVASIKSSFELADDNPWDQSMTESVLSSLANMIGEGNGEYSSELTYDNSITSKPKIYLAPALILRKRSVRGLEIVLDKIKELVKAKASMPQWFNDLCEQPRSDTDIRSTGTSEDLRGEPPSRDLEDTTVYFPLPSNSQQRQILEKWQSADGILVQGPPGTGKSLTIANLICHLLAMGQRVLVTAKTPRALQVLHRLLPPDIGALCVSLLGRGAEERENLQKSIASIHSREGEWDPSRSETHIKDLEKKLNDKRAEQAAIEARIRNLRERDAGRHSILDEAYSGTAAKIAALLTEEASKFEWLTDEAPDCSPPPVTHSHFLAYRRELLFFSSDKKQELSYEHIEPSQMPSSDQVRHLIMRESILQKELTEMAPLLDDRLEQIFQATDTDLTRTLLASLDSLYAETKTVLNRPYEWIPTAVSEILSDRDTPWKDLESVTATRLNGLKARAQNIDGQRLDAPPALQEGQLLSDSKSLRVYLEKGGSWRFWALKPRAIKCLRYIYKDVCLDGQRCDSMDILLKIIDHLEVTSDITYLWNLWQTKVDRVTEPLFIQVAHLEEALEALSASVVLYEKMEAGRRAIRMIEGLQEPAWHSPDQVYQLCCACRVVLNQAELKHISSQLADMTFRLDSLAKKPRMHPYVSESATAIRERDYVRYPKMLTKAEELQTLTSRWNDLKKFERLAVNHFPRLTEALQQTADASHWETRLASFDKACTWARARKWLTDYLSTDNLPSLRARLNQCEAKINSLLSQLAAEKAWSACLTRMTEEQSRNLKLFSRVRIPKSGKTVLRKRREAQKYLNNCRDAVPAWIMPLHRVYDTVVPSADKFDVIIVDEASQCGQEALPLFLLGHKIIIVGDNKQISPMTVGVKDELIQQLVQRHLHDFQYKETFEPQKSLFDQAFYRFPAHNQIRLREHFRCMPEIIRFSNDLCYADQPLIPLRQFSSHRLEPLKRVYVPTGYRQGTSANAINKPEAEAVVEAIVTCCADDAYQDKSMGVIVLQGHAQDRLIEDMLAKELDPQEIENRRLICGTPYSFQGDERDVIFLSMIAAPNERITSLTSEDFIRRFNVAASRAKDQMWLFHSADLPDLGLTCLRRKLLSFFMGSRSIGAILEGRECQDLDDLRHKALNTNRSLVNAPEPFGSWFEIDVFLDLVNRGYRVLPQYQFAGRRIDFVVEGHGGEQLAVECYGDYWHGADQYEKDVLRQRQLERCGWIFHIIRECEYRADPANCMATLQAELNHRGIQPWKPTATHTESLQEVKAPTPEDVTGEVAPQPLMVPGSSDTKTSPLSTIQQALELKAKHLQSIIIQVMSRRPNRTCMKDKLHNYILKELGILTRGAPRQKFARKVAQSVRHLVNNKKLQVYKSKNDRLRLLEDHSTLF